MPTRGAQGFNRRSLVSLPVAAARTAGLGSQMRSDLMETNDATISPSRLRDPDPVLNLQFHKRLGASIKR
jgi:hypothetical protein